MEGILKSLGIEYNTNSVNYKQLRRSFFKLYLIRYDWIKDLIKETGRTDDDSETLSNGWKYVGEWREGKPWNITIYGKSGIIK